MKAVSKIGIPVVVFLMFSPMFAFGSAANIYITQSGSPSGNCTTNVQTPAFFNTASNWGSGSSQIGPGTTVLFCGTFAGTAGQTGFTFQGSGASGNPVILKFDTGAQMTAPYWGSATSGAISCTGRNYVTVDGGANGVIQNTANGTSLANHQSSYGIFTSNCTNTEIRNLTIQNIYLNQGSTSSATDTAGQNTGDIYLQGTSTGSSVHDSVLRNARVGVDFDFDSGNDASNVSIYNNTISDHPWSIAYGADNASSTATNVKIYSNDISDWTNWQFPIATYHTDGVIAYNDVTTGPVATFQIYNNYFHGSLGAGSPTGYIACGETTACTIFNNLMVDGAANLCSGYIWVYAFGGPHSIYNNTIVGGSASQNIAINLNAGYGTLKYSQVTVNNNISTNVAYAMVDYNTSTLSGDVTASNNNVWRTGSGTAPQLAFNFGGSSTFISFASWQGSGFDANSSTANPNLSGTYALQSGSSAIALGGNLNRVGIAALDSDKAGVVRSGSGSWDAGVYTFGTPPAAPTSLAAIVQ